MAAIKKFAATTNRINLIPLCIMLNSFSSIIFFCFSSFFLTSCEASLVDCFALASLSWFDGVDSFFSFSFARSLSETAKAFGWLLSDEVFDVCTCVSSAKVADGLDESSPFESAFAVFTALFSWLSTSVAFWVSSWFCSVFFTPDWTFESDSL